MDSIEPLNDLIARIEAMLPEIDLERDISKDTACIIAISEMSGTPLTERVKKFHVLMQQNRITTDECLRIFEDYSSNRSTKTKNAARLAGAVKTDMKNIPVEDLSMK